MNNNKGKSVYLKYFLSALAIVAGGFFLFNIVFLIFAGIINGILFFLPDDFTATDTWFMPVAMSMIGISFLVGFYFLFKSKLPQLIKAVLMTVPAAIVFVGIGVALYKWPWAIYTLSILIGLTVFYYFYRSKQPWLYYFSILYVAIALIIMSLTGTDI